MTAASPRFTVLMRIGHSPELFPHSLASVLAQTEGDFELVILGAGGTGRSGAALDDPRIRGFDGDRAAALRDARGVFVAEAGDEALWFPDHLRELGALLDEVAFGNLLHVELDPDGSLSLTPGDLSDPATRERMVSTGWSCVDASCAGYRLTAYRELPVAPDPPDVPADMALWRRFLTAPGVTVGTRFAVESLTVRAAYRPDPAARADEGAALLARIRDDRSRRELRSRAFASWQADLAATQAALDVTAAQLHEVYRSRGEIAAQLGEYAHSRAAYAERNVELGARLAEQTARLAEQAGQLHDQDARLAEQTAQVALLRGQVVRLRARCRRLRVRNERLRARLAAAAARPSLRRTIGRLGRRLRRR